jgi:hypothetical protein
MSIVRGERFFQVFEGVDASIIHNSYLREWFQLGSHNFQAVEHLHTPGSDTKRRGDSSLLHGIIFVGFHVRQKCLYRNEPKLARFRAPSPFIFQRFMGERVQKILLPHLQ